MISLSTAVGKGAHNPSRDEVRAIQRLLNAKRSPGQGAIDEDGLVGTQTITAITDFQRRALKMNPPDGRIDPGGRTLQALSQRSQAARPTPMPKPTPVPPPRARSNPNSGYFHHPDAGAVVLNYGANAVRLSADAEALLKSILASCDIASARLTSTLRTYHDQARITLTQTYPSSPAKVATWYGQPARDACEANRNDVAALARWWEQYDKKRGRVSSKHLTNRAMDVVPGRTRAAFAAKVKELVDVSGSGVRRIIPQGTMGEPVDHVEFTFDVT